MKHLGDITKIHGDQIEPVDVITFGSPCQDLSVAGKRAGLAGERSGLFVEAVRIIKEMRSATDGIYPNFAVWENVPGAFSSNKGEDFRAVLEELVRIQEPDTVIPKPPKGKWQTVGGVLGDRWSLAWRVLDAQFWGVPQRRRRIALVMDFGGQSAPEILFERKGMQRNSAPGGKARKRIARDIKKSVGGTGREECYPINLQIATRHKSLGKGTGFGVGDDGEPAYTLQAGHEHGVCAPTYCLQGSMIGRADKNGPQGNGVNEDVSFTLNATDRHAVCEPIAFDGYNQTVSSTVQSIRANKSDGDHVGMVAVPYGICSYASNSMKSDNPHSGIYEAQTSRTLDLNGGNPACNQGGIAICEPQIYDARDNGDGKVAPTMTGDHQNRITDYTGIVCFDQQAYDKFTETDTATTLKACGGSYGGRSENLVVTKKTIRYRVRRLTPLECERLQGYPDGWTNIPDYIDDKGKKKSASDSARYKALGNSIALPPWKWVLKRISAQFERDATLGSLFDGIGGFPLIWEQLNGKGSARWASEIEQFPIAVTKYHFDGGGKNKSAHKAH